MAIHTTDKSESSVMKFEHPCPEAADSPHFANLILFVAAFRAGVF
jgi:hypothetical protein